MKLACYSMNVWCTRKGELWEGKKRASANWSSDMDEVTPYLSSDLPAVSAKSRGRKVMNYGTAKWV